MQIKQIIHDVLIYVCYKSAKNSTILPTKMFSALGVLKAASMQQCVLRFPFHLFLIQVNTDENDLANGKMKVKVKWKCKLLSLCPTLCDPMDCSLPSSSIRGFFQARMLEWVAISFSRGFFLTEGSNPGLVHCGQVLYHLTERWERAYSLNASGDEVVLPVYFWN